MKPLKTEVYKLTYESGQSIDIERIVTKRRNMAIKVFPDGRVKIYAPSRYPASACATFLESKKEWIKKHNLLGVEKQRRTQKNYQTGELHLYMGMSFPLDKKWKNGIKKPSVQLEENALVVCLPEEGQPAIKEILEKWYRVQAKEVFLARLAHYTAITGLKPNRVTIKAQKTRWGSCSGKKNLNLNWHCIKAPIEIVDYVIVHELCHLVHMNHSTEFWNLVRQMMPDFEWRRKWLKNNGSAIMGS